MPYRCLSPIYCSCTTMEAIITLYGGVIRHLFKKSVHISIANLHALVKWAKLQLDGQSAIVVIGELRHKLQENYNKILKKWCYKYKAAFQICNTFPSKLCDYPDPFCLCSPPPPPPRMNTSTKINTSQCFWWLQRIFLWRGLLSSTVTQIILKNQNLFFVWFI